MSLGRDDLVCSHFTLTGAPPMDPPRFAFAQRVAAAAKAGFAGIGVMGADYLVERQAGLSQADADAILDDHGIMIAEVEFLYEWSAGPDEPDRVARAAALEDGVWAVADAFGPRVVSVGEVVGPDELPPLDVLAERFGALCDRAAAHELLVALEFMPFSGIADLATAADVVLACDRPNAGINVDTWHYFRGGEDAETLRRVADRVHMVQFDDADANVGDDLFAETQRRRYPGEGSFDLVGFVLLLDDAGVGAPISVEVISPENQALSVTEAARRSFDTTHAVVHAARHV